MWFRAKGSPIRETVDQDGHAAHTGAAPGTGERRGVSSHAMRTPDAVAVSCGNRKLTYSGLDARSSRLARAMKRLGVRSGDSVVTLLPTSFEHLETTVAASKLDAVIVPMTPWARPDLIGSSIVEIAPSLVVAPDALWSELISRHPELEAVKCILLIDQDGPRHCTFTAGRCEEYESALSSVGVVVEPLRSVHGARLGLYRMTTSSTRDAGLHVTAQSGREIADAQEGQLALWGWAPDDVYLLCAGGHHPGPGGWAQAALHVGARIVIMAHWNPEEWLETVERERVSRTFLTPRHFKDLLDLPSDVWDRFDLSSLHTVAHGGAQCPVAVKMRIIERLAPAEIWEVFGTVDATVARIASVEWVDRPGSVGFPQVPIEVVGPDGRSVPVGHRGIIRWSPAKRQPATCGNTHVGYLDDDGYLFVTDRVSDGIHRGKTVVYPWEVEEVIHGHREVDDCVVFGAETGTSQQKMVAVVQASSGTTVETISSHCRLYLAEAKCPDEIVLVGSIERDELGKASRSALSTAYRHRTGDFTAGGVANVVGVAVGEAETTDTALSAELDTAAAID